MSVPAAVTVAVIEEELPAVEAYANRHGWSMGWDAESLVLSFEGQHKASAATLKLSAAVDGYRALPPSWSFEQEVGRTWKPCFPQAQNLAPGKGSIFHGSGVICAPFNRQAYKEHGGPHQDWGGTANWLHVNKDGHVRATNIADMLAVILGHLHVSPGLR